MYLYGFTVQGIQAYIFQTNNLREIIGASEIVEAVCTTWFDKFLIEKGIQGESVQQAAGNIKFYTTKENAQIIFSDYAAYVNQNAPGLPFSHAVVEGLDLDGLNKKLSSQRNQPLYDFDLGHAGRYLARSTGDAAVELKTSKIKDSILGLYKAKRNNAVDKVNFAKFENSEPANKTLLQKAKIRDSKELVEDFYDMAADGKHSWLALIHIDGNGMGNEIRRINTEYKEQKDKINKITEFAKGIAESTNAAFQKAYLKTFENYKGLKTPFRPLILGGDDVTVILRADFALDFVQTYLTEYQNETNRVLNKEYTACAGIAFVKAKFPFHFSADLAEELCAYCKNKSGRDKSAILFHKVSDSFISDYHALIEKELTLPDTNKTRISNNYYALKDIPLLRKETEIINDQKGLKNAIRQWTDLAMNGDPEANLIKNRSQKKYTKQADILKNESQYADYLTLLAVS